MRQTNKAIALRIAPSEHRTSAGTAYGTGCEIIGEFDAVFCYRINGWAVNCFDTITSKVATGVVNLWFWILVVNVAGSLCSYPVGVVIVGEVLNKVTAPTADNDVFWTFAANCLIVQMMDV